MDDDEKVDWDAFAILAADPEIDVGTAYAGSIRDEPPEGRPPQRSSGSAGVAVSAILIVLGIALLLLAL